MVLSSQILFLLLFCKFLLKLLKIPEIVLNYLFEVKNYYNFHKTHEGLIYHNELIHFFQFLKNQKDLAYLEFLEYIITLLKDNIALEIFLSPPHIFPLRYSFLNLIYLEYKIDLEVELIIFLGFPSFNLSRPFNFRKVIYKISNNLALLSYSDIKAKLLKLYITNMDVQDINTVRFDIDEVIRLLLTMVIEKFGMPNIKHAAESILNNKWDNSMEQKLLISLERSYGFESLYTNLSYLVKNYRKPEPVPFVYKSSIFKIKKRFFKKISRKKK